MQDGQAQGAHGGGREARHRADRPDRKEGWSRQQGKVTVNVITRRVNLRPLACRWPPWLTDRRYPSARPPGWSAGAVLRPGGPPPIYRCRRAQWSGPKGCRVGVNATGTKVFEEAAAANAPRST